MQAATPFGDQTVAGALRTVGGEPTLVEAKAAPQRSTHTAGPFSCSLSAMAPD